MPALFIITVILYQRFSEGGVAGLFSLDFSCWNCTREKIPFLAFGIIFLLMAVLSFLRSYSLIPVLGFLCCTYLLCESGTSNWERFLIWLVIGLVIYFLYGRHKSKMNKERQG
ncbi:MAG: hypothetical protein H3C54_07785 [Taibaiella sp.]|nr:hypothetical protein [Taibaiella sp.]